MGQKRRPVGAQGLESQSFLSIFHNKDLAKGLAKGVSGDLLVDLHHEKGRRQDGRGHAPYRPRHGYVFERVLRSIVPVDAYAATILLLLLLLLATVQESAGCIVRPKIHALYHSNRYQGPRYTGIQGTDGASDRRCGVCVADDSCSGCSSARSSTGRSLMMLLHQHLVSRRRE